MHPGTAHGHCPDTPTFTEKPPYPTGSWIGPGGVADSAIDLLSVAQGGAHEGNAGT
jgi:hypothetical protein